jgi:hypothetical protein
MTDSEVPNQVEAQGIVSKKKAELVKQNLERELEIYIARMNTKQRIEVA